MPIANMQCELNLQENVKLCMLLKPYPQSSEVSFIPSSFLISDETSCQHNEGETSHKLFLETCLFKLLELRALHQVVVRQQLAHVLYRIPQLPHAANLVSGSVSGPRITHTVPMVSVGVCLHHNGAILQHKLLCILHALQSITGCQASLQRGSFKYATITFLLSDGSKG